jgi:hypothetical protein
MRYPVPIPANFPDSGGIFPILTILPDFLIEIFKILYFPDFLSLSTFFSLQQSTTNSQPKFKIPRHFVTPANQNRDKQSPLLHVYLLQRVETMWTSVIIWGHLTFVSTFSHIYFILDENYIICIFNIWVQDQSQRRKKFTDSPVSCSKSSKPDWKTICCHGEIIFLAHLS